MRTFGYIMLGLLIIIGLAVSGFVMKSCSIAENHIENSMENAVISYDEYQNIYGACQQINSDLKVLKDTPDNDPQFEQFSKAQRINTMKQNLNRWITEYNAKSKHIDKKWWKADNLPQTLSTSLFENY